MVRIVTNVHQSRTSGIWANTEVEVLEYGELQDVARPIGSQRVSLRAALREIGGRIEARYAPSKPLVDAYHGSDHLSLIEQGGEAYGYTRFIRGFRCVAIHFDDTLLGEACGSATAAAKFRSRLMFENKPIWAMADRLALACVTPRIGQRLYCESLVGMLAVELAGLETIGRGAACKGGLAPFRLRRILDYIEDHLGENIALTELAAISEVSLAHFMRAFRTSTGEAPLRFIMRRRVARATRLLLETSTPLVQIAHDCGFADRSHMTTCFRRIAGNTPGRIRSERS
ncbi:AraC family transcriptional regulator [Cupriavidus pauculus]|uniref:AraC family transcriptional regulator n=1 Tax=Cupriavidus pauculus TaxID=82633 RepID=A0A3G8HA38_9BURK|nr:AraC family transcriptional regulator [Cupriavidus pauculus]AZG17276.1 AraC family transcriptional regulator [Cupriavidus pauculus]